MREVNAFDVLSAHIPLQSPTVGVLFVLLLVIAVIRGLFSSITASYLVLFPILLEFTELLGLNSLYLSFGLAIVLMSTTFFPLNNPTVLVAYERGPLRKTEVLLLGLLTMAFAVLVVALSWTLYWPIADSMSVALGR